MRSFLAVLVSMLVSLGQPGTASATLVKCRGDQGSVVVYQDAPCRAGMELRNFDTDPATLSVVPGLPLARPAEARGAASRVRYSPSARRPPEHGLSASKAAERRFIRTGMTEAEVIRRIGKPAVDAGTASSKRKQGKSTRLWSYLPAAGDPDTVTTVTLAGGLVTDVERKIVR
jgi:hypothetical protein